MGLILFGIRVTEEPKPEPTEVLPALLNSIERWTPWRFESALRSRKNPPLAELQRVQSMTTFLTRMLEMLPLCLSLNRKRRLSHDTMGGSLFCLGKELFP